MLSLNISELFKANSKFENGTWWTDFYSFDTGHTELRIQGNEQGVLQSQLDFAEKIINKYLIYEKHGLDLLTYFVPNVYKSDFSLFSIDFVGFTNGAYGMTEAFTTDCFIITWDCKKIEDFLFSVKFALCSVGCIDDIYCKTVEIWR